MPAAEFASDMKFARRDADIGEARLGENAPEIIGVAERERPGRLRRDGGRRAEPAHDDVVGELPVRVVGDRRPHRHREAAAVPQGAMQIAEGGERIGEEHHAEPRDNQVEARRREVVRLGIGEQQFDIAEAGSAVRRFA